MKKITDLIKEDTPVLIDFFANWCGPCKVMQPILEELKSKVGEKLHILKVDIDKQSNHLFVEKYKIASVPTFILFKGGKMLWRQSGALPITHLLSVVEKYL